jgi:hypothetical protein
MNRAISTLSKVLPITAAVGALSAVLFVGSPAEAQWVPPPPEVVATMEPVYFEGHAAYWYGNHWYYRDERGGWNHYDHEPPGLAERRAQRPPERRSWEHWRR